MEDEEKGIKLKLEMEKEGRITFLEMEIERRKEGLKMKWYQKKESAGIYCNWRSDVDKGTKRNVIKNLERKIGRASCRERV